jgi:hypothetical protein
MNWVLLWFVLWVGPRWFLAGKGILHRRNDNATGFTAIAMHSFPNNKEFGEEEAGRNIN